MQDILALFTLSGDLIMLKKTGGSHGDTQENKINSSTEKRDM